MERIATRKGTEILCCSVPVKPSLFACFEIHQHIRKALLLENNPSSLTRARIVNRNMTNICAYLLPCTACNMTPLLGKYFWISSPLALSPLPRECRCCKAGTMANALEFQAKATEIKSSLPKRSQVTEDQVILSLSLTDPAVHLLPACIVS
jgi:hypothetical protein